MVKLRKKLLAVLLTAAMVLSMGTFAWSEEAPAPDADAPVTEETQTPDASGEAEDTKDEKEEAAVKTDAEGLAEMEVVAQNNNFKLYLNKTTTVFAVESKKDGHVWWSSPVNSENDPVAKATQKRNMSSPFYVNYGDLESHTPDKISAYDGSIKSKAFKISNIENGVRIDYTLKKVKAVIPMTITLGEDFVNVSILSDEIEEEDAEKTTGIVILEIGLQQFFGAASTAEEGYMIIPDGSGAVIEFNNQKTSSKAYSGQVYGRDTSVGLFKRGTRTEQVYLPVLGNVVKNSGTDYGFLAVATSGDACAEVNANVSLQNTTSYNTTWFEFTMRTEDTYYMGQRKLTVYEAGKIRQPKLSVNYYPLEGDDLSYVDVASKYRDYLIKDKGLKDKKDDIKSNYYLDVYGGTVKTQSIAGFPVDLETPATTYAQAEEIAKKLTELGVGNIVMNYNEFDPAGINGLISAGMEYSGTLGGKNAFSSLHSYIEGIGGQLFPSVGINYMKKSGNGYSYSLNACRRVTKSYATTNNWDIAFGIPHQVRQVIKTTLSPYYWTDLERKLTSSFSKEGYDTISLGEFTTLLYSDFSRGNYTRSDAEQMIIETLGKFKDAGFKLLADGANAYAIPYADFITNVPLTSSNYDIFDYDIPFYEIVLHGVVPYTTTAINASSEASETIMLALSTATPVHYDMMYVSPNKFTDSDYETLFYSLYSGWLESSANMYKLVNDKLGSVANQKIVSHKYLSADEVETVYEDGTKVVVDLLKNKMSINGNSVDLTNYGLKGEVTSE